MEVYKHIDADKWQITMTLQEKINFINRASFRLPPQEREILVDIIKQSHVIGQQKQHWEGWGDKVMCDLIIRHGVLFKKMQEVIYENKAA